MSINKEAELMKSILTFFHRCEEEGDYNALYEMGFGPEEVRALSTLSTADTLRLASTKSHFLTIKLNRKVYWRMIDYIVREKHRDEIVDELISCDAPPKLVRSLTGMSSKQFKLKRCELGLEVLTPGRPPQPTLEEAKSVWKEVEKNLARTASFGPKEFLNIFNALNRQVSLRMIWNLIEEWESDGSLNKLRNR